jgi:hypothetical protein
LSIYGEVIFYEIAKLPFENKKLKIAGGGHPAVATKPDLSAATSSTKPVEHSAFIDWECCPGKKRETHLKTIPAIPKQ